MHKTDIHAAREMAQRTDQAAVVGVADGRRERRSGVRFAKGIRLEVSCDPQMAAATWAVTVRSVSDGGFSFRSRRELPVGTAIVVRAFTVDDSGVWLPARVVETMPSLRGHLVSAALDSGASSASE